MQDYTQRMILPINGESNILFATKSKLLVAKGYNRVVIGDRGPYIEFEHNQIEKNNFHLIPNLSHRYYTEWRSNCENNVKLYYQLLTVNYADYIIGKCYISPFDLISDKYPILITPLERRNKEK